MANPNLANINTYYARTRAGILTTALSNILVSPPTSNGMIKLNSLILSNGSVNQANINVRLYDRNNLEFPIINSLVMPSGNIAYVVNKTNEIILNEGYSLRANSNILNAVNFTANYEDFSEQTQITYLAGPSFGMDVLVIGGGGGASRGGGGAGGLLSGTGLSTSSNTTYTIIVGSGGAGKGPSVYSGGILGNNSLICSSAGSNLYVAVGGGAGGGYQPAIPHGGSGGGAAVNFATPGQGNNGSTDYENPGSCGGGGGGGAGQCGGNAGNAPGTTGGFGGNGCNLDFTGVFKFYAGGGGGGTLQAGTGAGGAGGGGPGETSGTVNTGGGGGGSRSPGVDNQSTGPGGSGGSGIVILRHPTDLPIANTSGNVTISANAGYRIYQFNGSGTITF